MLILEEGTTASESSLTYASLHTTISSTFHGEDDVTDLTSVKV